MKKLIALSLLATLVSCNGKSGDSSKSSTASTSNTSQEKSVIAQQEKGLTQEESILKIFEKALSTQKVGMVFLDQSSGYRNQITDNNGVYSTKKVNYSNEYEKEIILKIEGDLVYKYSETLSDGEKEVSVILESSESRMREAQEMITKLNLKVTGNRLVGAATLDVEDEATEDFTMVYGKTNVTFSIAMDNMLCDHVSTTVNKGTLLKTSSQTLKLKDELDETKGSCLKSLSNAELKKINLSNISFCDERSGSEEVNCEHRDMSFLTSDL